MTEVTAGGRLDHANPPQSPRNPRIQSLCFTAHNFLLSLCCGGGRVQEVTKVQVIIPLSNIYVREGSKVAFISHEVNKHSF